MTVGLFAISRSSLYIHNDFKSYTHSFLLQWQSSQPYASLSRIMNDTPGEAIRISEIRRLPFDFGTTIPGAGAHFPLSSSDNIIYISMSI